MTKKHNKSKINYLFFITIITVGVIYFTFQQFKSSQIYQINSREINSPFSQTIKLTSTPSDQQYIEVPSSDKQVLRNNFTIEAWIKPNPPELGKPAVKYTIIHKNIVGTLNSKLYSLDMDVSQLNTLPNPTFNITYNFSWLGRSCISNNNIFVSKLNLSLEKYSSWKHIAVVVKDDKAFLFENGLLLKNNSGNFASPKNCNSASPLFIGATVYNTGRVNYAFDGLIDEVRLSNSSRYINNFALSQYPYSSDANTIALYHLDSEVEDSSGNNSKGFVHGQPIYVESDLVVPQASPSPTVKPSCKPRPACLDASPACKIKETTDMCPPITKDGIKPRPTPIPSRFPADIN